jgi:hypothetical protein
MVLTSSINIAWCFFNDLDDPSKVIARTEQPIMIPSTEYELSGFFGNVVFTNGHIAEPMEIPSPFIMVRRMNLFVVRNFP